MVDKSIIELFAGKGRLVLGTKEIMADVIISERRMLRS